ncbi:MAG TPA: type III pantothenate kinase [Bacillota bacterium]|nr:type III pantothenate kinase [Bacillota bacterium]
MLLAFDIGNIRIVAGAFIQGRWIDWEIQTDRLKTADEYGILFKSLLLEAGLDPAKVQGAVIAGVVPPLTGVIEKMLQKYFNARIIVVGPGIKTGLSIRIENPREIGADLIVNAVAALHRYQPPLIIVDFGTATTFCAIGADGAYLGGAIAPGMDIAGEALFAQTAKLPRFEMVRPKNVIGKNTIGSLQSGLYFGYLGLVDSLISRMKAELKGNPVVVATGSLASMIAADAKYIDRVDQNLTLEGLRLVYEMNNND